MKTLIINGSPRIGGNTSIALEEMIKVFEKEEIEVHNRKCIYRRYKKVRRTVYESIDD